MLTIDDVFICRTCASKDIWKTLEGTFVVSKRPDRVVFFLEGPPPGIDLLIKSVTIHCESDNQFEVTVTYCGLLDRESESTLT